MRTPPSFSDKNERSPIAGTAALTTPPKRVAMSNTPRDPPASADKDSAAFGFRQVAAETRQGLVNQVFSTVAARYDLMVIGANHDGGEPGDAQGSLN